VLECEVLSWVVVVMAWLVVAVDVVVPVMLNRFLVVTHWTMIDCHCSSDVVYSRGLSFVKFGSVRMKFGFEGIMRLDSSVHVARFVTGDSAFLVYLMAFRYFHVFVHFHSNMFGLFLALQSFCYPKHSGR
jgi:hypothetical protein